MKAKFRVICILVMLSCMCVGGQVYGDGVESGMTVEPGIRAKLKVDRDGPKTLYGKIIRFHPDGLEFQLSGKPTEALRIEQIGWDELPSGMVYQLHVKHYMDKRSYGAWTKLGRMLVKMPDGMRHARKAFEQAKFVDKEWYSREFKNKTANEIVRELWDEHSASEGGDAKSSGKAKKSSSAKAPEASIELQWPKLSEFEMNQAVSSLKEFADDNLTKTGHEMMKVETDYFLFYTDLKRNEAKRWANELDRMYVKLAELFGVPKGENIWRGKCLIFVFAKSSDFQEFERVVYKVQSNPTGGTVAGRCYQFGNGDVHVVFYRQEDEIQFAKVLVHEAAHGFLYRYRSRINVPSCWNEGLADTIADMLLPRWDLLKARQNTAIRYMKSHKHPGGDFFTADHISAYQYGIASKLTQYMIEQDKKRYVQFINAIKANITWQHALKDYYGVTEFELMKAFGKSFGVKGLEPYAEKKDAEEK